jgi:hypothetical protein
MTPADRKRFDRLNKERIDLLLLKYTDGITPEQERRLAVLEVSAMLPQPDLRVLMDLRDRAVDRAQRIRELIESLGLED